jgi:hypothetical protein
VKHSIALAQEHADACRRTERIHCTLEQRQQGLGAVINALQTMLHIVSEQRLRS